MHVCVRDRDRETLYAEQCAEVLIPQPMGKLGRHRRPPPRHRCCGGDGGGGGGGVGKGAVLLYPIRPLCMGEQKVWRSGSEHISWHLTDNAGQM